ncbi:MAG: hypothetical protein WBA74_12160 [Cyclobacteriaceae bacterium]
MIHIQRLGLNLVIGLLLCLSGCDFTDDSASYSAVESRSIPNYNEWIVAYDVNNPESNNDPVTASFLGEHDSSIKIATKLAYGMQQNTSVQDEARIGKAIKYFSDLLQSDTASQEIKNNARRYLSLLERPKSTEEIFDSFQPVNAIEYITQEAERYHFTLINEAHYSAINRAYTTRLLKPLWEKGYRYLALEALSYQDSGINNRSYPILSSGYYIKESSFGMMVREALELGFQLIPYETQDYSHDGTERDKDQAENIFRQTLSRDSIGKVLVHVGYGHLGEEGGSSYMPMGAQLKAIANQDILTIDQQTMLPLDDLEKLHPFLKYIYEHELINMPTVFKNDEFGVLRDPVNHFSVDIQVYHPKSRQIDGRPDYLVYDEANHYKLNDEISDFQYHLLQVTPSGEPEDAIPVDQFIIRENKAIIAKPGSYKLRIIDPEGTLVGEAYMTAK